MPDYVRAMSLLIDHLPAASIVLALVIAERRIRGGAGDWQINLSAWAMSLLASATIYGAVSRWQGVSLLDGNRLPGWLAVMLFVIVSDLGEYVFHRMQHRIPLLWSMHSLHHSDPDMSALTTSRHFWADPLFKTITVWSAAALLITPTPAALLAYNLLSLWNFVVHSGLPLNLGRWSWLLNTPAYHRRHHSKEPAHFDSNFAALFPIWDMISGTYHVPIGFPATGLEVRPRTARELLFWPIHYRRWNARPVSQEPAATSLLRTSL